MIVPLLNVAVHRAAQDIPAGVLDTRPLPATATVSRYLAGPKAAVTVRSPSRVT